MADYSNTKSSLRCVDVGICIDWWDYMGWLIDSELTSLTTGEMMRIPLVLLLISLLHVPGEVVG